MCKSNTYIQIRRSDWLSYLWSIYNDSKTTSSKKADFDSQEIAKTII